MARPARTSEGTLDPLVRGSLAHAALEYADADPVETLATTAKRYEIELSDGERDDILRIVAAYTTSDLAARVTGAQSVKREFQFAYPLGGTLVTGVVDVLAIEADGHALVVDYKSHRLEPDTDLEELVERDYAVQRRTYALAALADGAPSAEVAYAFLERPAAPITTLYDRNDIPRLQDELEQLAEGVIEGEFAVSDTPHFDLCAGCPGRRSLCIHDEELTSRELV
jgi:hypothetical protein